MRKVLLSILMVAVMFSGAWACQGDECTIQTPDVTITVGSDVGIYGSAIEGKTSIVGCNADGMFERTNMNFVGSSAGVSASTNIEITENTDLGDVIDNCIGCDLTAAGGINVIDFAGHVGIDGQVIDGNNAAGYYGDLCFKGTSVSGAIHLQ